MSLVQEAWNDTYESIQVINPNVSVEDRDNIFEKLYYGYVGSKANLERTYHNFDHVLHCLTQLQFLSNMGKIEDTLALELALWFHDVFYDIRCNCNEEMSANIATDSLKGIVPDAMLFRIKELIKCTKYSGCLTTPYVPNYTREDDDQDHLYIRDIDFSGFALLFPQVLEAGRNIRNESPFLDDLTFYEKRVKFLSLLVQDDFKIYHTELLNTMYEDTAKYNIRREIEHCEGMIRNLQPLVY